SAADAGAAELEQRLHHLLMADESRRQLRAIELREAEEEVPVLLLGLEQVVMRLHVERLAIGHRLRLRGADVDAELATRAVFRRDLNRVREALPILVHRLQRLEGRRRFALQIL